MNAHTNYLIVIFCLLGLNLRAQQQIFLSPRGNDKNAGTVEKPLKTIQEAIRLANTKADNESVEILLRKGCYEQAKTLEIGNQNRLTIKPYQREQVSISGGREIAIKHLKKISDKKLLARLQPQVKAHIRELDLKRLHIPMAGLRPSGFGRPSSPAWSEMFVNGSPLSIARWPNNTTVSIGEVLVKGTGEHTKESSLPVFRYQESHPSTWTDAGSFWISGYFAHGYADDMIPVQKIDTVNKTIHVGEQTVYGFMTGAPWRQWFALNLVEELDRAGEYVIDTIAGKMYLYLPDEPITSLHVSVLDQPLLAVENSIDVSVEGITFEYGRSIGIYMENTDRTTIRGCTVRNMGGVGISIGQGTETLDKKALKPHAAEAGGNPVSRIIGDLLGKVYQDILFNRNGGTGNGVVDCYIYNVGSGGVSLGGGDRATLTPAGNYVQNCRIHDYNRVEKSYRPAIWIDGVGNRVSQCDIYNAPSMAILFHGNDHLIELCRITNVCGEVDDQGAIYYGRDPSERGHIIRYCYFKDLSPRHRVTATYHDDGACGAHVYGNIYFRAGSLPVLIGGGHDIRYSHNLFIDSPVAIHIDNRMQGWGAGMVASNGIIDQRLNTVRHTQPPYSDRYPELVNYWSENPAFPHRNVIEGNLFYKIGNVLHGKAEWGEFKNNWETTTDPGFIDPADPLKGFKPDAELFKRIPDFPALPFDQIGCQLPKIDSI